MKFKYYNPKTDKQEMKELEAYFLHFTRKVNLPLIDKEKALLMKPPEGYQTGCLNGTGIYAYNLELITKSQRWDTLPSGVVNTPDEFVCILFATTTPEVWWCDDVESTTAYDSISDSRMDCPLEEYEVLSVEEAFTLANTSLERVKAFVESR